jgi:hypothetical protein
MPFKDFLCTTGNLKPHQGNLNLISFSNIEDSWFHAEQATKQNSAATDQELIENT